MKALEKHWGLWPILLASMALPAAELLALRLWLHRILEFHPGLPGFVDYDLLLPLPISWATFLWVAWNNGWTIRFSSRAVAANLVMLTAFVTHSSLLASQSSQSSLSKLIFWVLAAGVATTATEVFFRLSQIFKRERVWIFCIGTVAAFSLVLLKNIFDFNWTRFATLSADSSCAILKAVSNKGGCQWFQDGHLLIYLGTISAFIGSHCAGSDAMILMVCSLAIFSVKKGEIAGARILIPIWVFGVIYAFGLNQFRILSMLFAASLLSSIFGTAYANDIFQRVFHVHAGWFIYLVGLGVYFVICNQLVSSKRLATELGER